jgi:hypothetical protein
MRRLLLALAVLAGGAAAARAADLDSCQVIVSGTGADRRDAALADCLTQALVKLSGDASLADDPSLPALAATAGTMVEDFAYFDRMGDIPHHDEQGSRDRPFDFLAHFAPAKLDATLAALGRHPWRGPRPVLALDVRVHDRAGDDFALTADGDDGERLRAALFAAGERFGLRVALPATGAAAPPPQGAVALHGTLRWSDADFGWVADWRLGDAAWQVRGVSFDAAFRTGIGGAAGRLAAGG